MFGETAGIAQTAAILDILPGETPEIWLAGITAFIISAVCGAPLIKLLRRAGLCEDVTATPIEDPKLRKRMDAKNGTPTMGGLIVMVGVIAGTLPWAGLSNPYAWILLTCAVGLGLGGGLDDLLKLKGQGYRKGGLRPRDKLICQAIVGVIIGVALWTVGPTGQGFSLLAWLLGGTGVLLALGYVAWVTGVVVVMANSTNISDGMDGLMSGLTILAAVTLAAASFTGLVPLSRGPVEPGAALASAVFCASLAGACLGFLLYNSYPARVFLGDVGSLAVGGSLGAAAVLGGAEILLPVLALVFLLELASSLAQIFAFKLTGRRILPIAPLHHIFEQKDWNEPTIVLMFYLAGTLCAFASLALAGI